MGPPNPKWGTFLDPVETRWIREEGNDRKMQLLADVRFMRRTGEVCRAEKGLIFDGASIPRPLWSILGSPFDGDYRDAAVIHDAGCKSRILPSAEVHAIFREAMMASGVAWWKANLMWAAVRVAGPRWKVANG